MMLHSSSCLYEHVCNVAMQVQKPQTCILALWHIFHQLSLLHVLCLKSLSLINMLTGNPIIIYNLLAITNLPVTKFRLKFSVIPRFKMIWIFMDVHHQSTSLCDVMSCIKMHLHFRWLFYLLLVYCNKHTWSPK